MSILNIVWSPDRVLVAVDTAGALRPELPAAAAQHAPAASGDLSKLIYLSAPGAVLACRGSGGLLGLLATQILPLWCTGFDDLAEALPGYARKAHQFIVQQAHAAGMPPRHLDEQEAALIGWSARRDRMVAIVASRENARLGFEVFDLADGCPEWIVPWWSTTEEPPRPTTDDGMMLLARRQLADAHALGHAKAGFGGRLVVADLTRKGASFRTLGTI